MRFENLRGFLFLIATLLLLIQSKETQLLENTNQYDTLLSQSTKEYFMVQNKEVKTIEVQIDLFTGNINLEIEAPHPNTVIKQKTFGKKKAYFISNDKTLEGNYKLKAIATTDSFYSIKYLPGTPEEYVIANDETVHDYIFVKNKSKRFRFNRPSGVFDYIVTLNSLNCDIEIEIEKRFFFVRRYQFVLDKEKDNYFFDISILKQDVPNTENEDEFCLLQFSSFGVNDKGSTSENKGILIDDNTRNKITLGQYEGINAVTYLYPYIASNEPNVVTISLYKPTSSPIKVITTIGENSQEYYVPFSHRKIRLYENDFNKYCNSGTLCPLIIKIEQDFRILKTSDFSEVYTTILTSNEMPIFLPRRSIRDDRIYGDQVKYVHPGHVQYYYTDVSKNEQIEIIVDFKRVNGFPIARIIEKGTIEKDANYDGRIRLPSKNDTDLIPFDFYNRKFLITEKYTSKCIKGCEIFISVSSDSESLWFNMVDYGIFIRSEESVTVLPLDTTAFGTLTQSENQNEYNFFQVRITKATDRLHIISSCELCNIYIKKGIEKPNKLSYDWLIDSGEQFTTISESEIKGCDVIENLILTIAVSTKQTDGLLSSYYSFKVVAPDLKMPSIIDMYSSNDELCSVKSAENYCYYRMPIIYRDFVIEVNLYAIDEATYESQSEIYAKIVDAYQFDSLKPEEKIKILPSEESSDFSSKGEFNSNHLFVSLRFSESDRYLLIALKPSEKSKIIKLASTFYNSPRTTNLHPYTYELFSLEPNHNITFPMNPENDESYYVEINCIFGEAYVFNTLYPNYINELSNGFQSNVGILVVPRNDGQKMSIEVQWKPERPDFQQNFLFYIKFTKRTDKGNFDEMKYGINNVVQYNEVKFPIGFYIPITKSNDLVVLVRLMKIAYKDILTTSLISNEMFTITGILTNGEFVANKKKSAEVLPEIGAYASSLYFDPGLQLARIEFKGSDIEDYSAIGGKYIYISLKPSEINTNSYKSLNIGVNTLPTINDIIPIPRNEYYFDHINTKYNLILYKMTKTDNLQDIMRIEYSGNVKGYDIAINTFNEDGSVNFEEMQKNKTNLIKSVQEANGKIIFTVGVDRYKEISFCFFKVDKSIEGSGSYILKYDLRSMKREYLGLELKNNTITVKSNKPGEIIMRVESIKRKNVPVESAAYILRVFPRYLYENEEELDSIYVKGHPIKTYTQVSEGEYDCLIDVLFNITDFPQGEYYVNVLGSIRGIQSELILYKTILISYKESSKNYNLIAIIIPVFIVIILIIAIWYLRRKALLIQQKAKIEKMEYSKLTELSSA